MTFACAICGIDAGTRLVCDTCAPLLTPAQDTKLLISWHRFIVERDGCECVYCGHSATADSGELCGNHTRGRRLPYRYDTAAGECVCKTCNDKFSSLPHDSMQRKKPETAGHKSRHKKDLCSKCHLFLKVYGDLCIKCKK